MDEILSVSAYSDLEKFFIAYLSTRLYSQMRDISYLNYIYEKCWSIKDQGQRYAMYDRVNAEVFAALDKVSITTGSSHDLCYTLKTPDELGLAALDIINIHLEYKDKFEL